MKRLFSKRVAIIAAVALLVVFLVRPGAERLRGRVSQSIGQALGRNVEVGSVHLRFLPRLGFDLGDLVIHDDPAFGTEPLLRSPDVTAAVSLMALLHGRIAIASLSLSDASLNLTRNDQGKWNIGDLLERTAHTSLAPTGSARKGTTPAFPYIEATHARINFKSGWEKLHFAFSDAEFALWQDSEDTWGARLRATPMRTDANLTDTGVIKLSGLWRRAARLHETPLQLSFEWKQAQIGQLSNLIFGSEHGWRGGVSVSGAVAGIPERLKVTADASVDNFRRQDVLGGGELQVTAHCGAEYNAATRSLRNLDCVAPAGSGAVEVKGSAVPGMSVASLLSSYDLWMVANHVPADSALNIARHINSNVAADISAGGEINAALQIRKSDAEPIFFDGHGSVEQLQLVSSTAGAVALGTVPFDFVAGEAGTVAARRRLSPGLVRTLKKHITTEPPEDALAKPRLEIGPVNLIFGRPAPLQARGELSLSGYDASLHGDAGIRRILQLAKVLGVPAPEVSADGGATLDLAVSGSWDAERPTVVGQAQLRSVHGQIRGVNSPIEITSANIEIDRDSVQVQNLVAQAGETTFRGSMQIPRPCPTPDACILQFNLRMTELSAASLNQLLNPAARERAWYSFLSMTSGRKPYLLQARASGKIAIDKLTLGKAACSHFDANLALNSGELTLSNIHGEILGGHVTGEWAANFAAKPPKYRGQGKLEGVALSQAADLMHDPWIDGTGIASYEVTASGWNWADLFASADLDSAFTISNGVFRHVVLGTSAAPLRVTEFAGNLRLQDGEFSFQDTRLKSPGSVYKLSGTATLNGALSLKMMSDTTAGFNVTGTLVKTRVAAIPVTQAALKQ